MRAAVVARPLFGLVVRPVQAFFRLEAASGIVLLACAAAALGWVNAAGPEAYRALLVEPFTIEIGHWAIRASVHAVIDDGLMTIFFFVVGLEIKRELVVGELRTFARASLPAVAALGGMLCPAAVYFALNAGHPGAPGWGIPMATDIAFCVGALTALGRRVPRGLAVFITALAIFDDVGGIVVIAAFYGTGISLPWLGAAAVVIAGVALLSRRGVGSGWAYLAAGALLWWTLHHGGIHPTLAGVVLGLAVPARARARPREVLDALGARVDELRRAPVDDELDPEAMLELGDRLQELQPPLERFLRRLHPWVAFGVMPLFALANSGVFVGGLRPDQLTSRIVIGVALGLVVGKTVGIFGFTLVAVRLGLAGAPGGASAPKLLGVSALAGIGFTLALFIGGLAFPARPELLDEARLGIIAGSLAAGLIGAVILAFTRPLEPGGGQGPHP